MIHKYCTTCEVHATALRFPNEVFTALLTEVQALDLAYGNHRDNTATGGYTIVIEDAADLSTLEDIVNVTTHPCEWAARLGTSGFISALYVMNNDFTITIFMPECIAPPSILQEI